MDETQWSAMVSLGVFFVFNLKVRYPLVTGGFLS